MSSTEGSARPVIPLARPDIGVRELELVTQVLQGDVLARDRLHRGSRP